MKEEDNDGGRRAYMRDYQRGRRARKKRVELLYDLDEYWLLKQEASRHGQKVAPFIKACTDAYLKKSYVVPDEEVVRDLRRALRSIGNNVNQIARRANWAGVEHQDLEDVIGLIYQLEDRIGEAFRNPEEWKP